MAMVKISNETAERVLSDLKMYRACLRKMIQSGGVTYKGEPDKLFQWLRDTDRLIDTVETSCAMADEHVDA